MKKILYFFPDNIGIQSSGNKTRAIYLLKYFKQKGYKVDYVSLKHEKEDQDTEQETVDLLKNNQLAENVYLLPRKPGKQNPVIYFLRYKIRDLFYYWTHYPFNSNIPTFFTVKLKHAFEALLKANSYDYIIVSYVFYADLIANKALTGRAKLIIDTHDFITAQFKDKRGFNLGATFQDEIGRLNAFDQIWAISSEEAYVFKQFCKADVKLVPMMMDAPARSSKSPIEKKYDIIYVASDNVHNVRSAKWFFEEVYPLLPATIKICVIGKINKSVPDNVRVERVPFAPELDTFYNDSRIAICPMLSGTGVKVKVVEALSFGLPVVCTENGTDGLSNKIDNGCLVSNEPHKFAELILQLLANTAFYEQQSSLALRFFMQSFETGSSFKMLDEIFDHG